VEPPRWRRYAQTRTAPPGERAASGPPSAEATARRPASWSHTAGRPKALGRRAGGGPTSFIAGPGHISSHRGTASAPASFATLFGLALREATMVGLVWVFQFLGILGLMVIPLIALTKRPPKGQSEMIAPH
jgi:hypothetical protein